MFALLSVYFVFVFLFQNKVQARMEKPEMVYLGGIGYCIHVSTELLVPQLTQNYS